MLVSEMMAAEEDELEAAQMGVPVTKLDGNERLFPVGDPRNRRIQELDTPDREQGFGCADQPQDEDPVYDEIKPRS